MYDRPPLLAVEYFVATAHLGTVRAAAGQLNVTPSAISHQIGRLEEFLNVPLFHRHKRRLILTEAGKHYLEQVEGSLTQIGQATRDIARHDKRRHLKISAPPTFLAFFLLPRLQSLLDLYPDLTLAFVDSLTFDPVNSDVDCAVEYRLHPDERLLSHKLFDDEVVPVASRAYVASLQIQSLADLRRCTLIEAEKRIYSWNNVLRTFSWRNSCRLIVTQFSYQAMTSASLDQGIALVNLYNAEYLLSLGRLIIPFTIDVGSYFGPSYFLSYSPKKEASSVVQAFQSWLLDQIAESHRARYRFNP